MRGSGCDRAGGSRAVRALQRRLADIGAALGGVLVAGDKEREQ